MYPHDDDSSTEHFDHMEIVKSNDRNPTPLSVCIGLVAGALAGLYSYMYIGSDSGTSIAMAMIVAVAVASVLRMISKNLFRIAVIAYVMYVLFF